MTEPTVYALAVAVALVAQIVLQIMAKLDTMRIEKEQRQRAKATAANVEEVKHQLQQTNSATDATLTKLTDVAEVTQKTGEKVHLLVNSAMTAALKVSAVALRRVAILTGQPGDIAAADLAEKSLKTHEDTFKEISGTQ